ncbi:MAG: hypothetical protein ABFS46_06485 [Myxococcota bacterium]
MAREAGWALFWGGVGAAVCAAVIPLQPDLLDEGTSLHVAQRLLRGERLYREVLIFTGPLPPEMLAWLFRHLGDEIVVARGVLVGLAAIASACAFGIGRVARAGPGAHLTAACLAAAPALLFPRWSIYAPDTLACYLSVPATFTALLAVRSAPWGLAAGALVAAVALCQPLVGIALFASLAIAVVISAPAGQRVGRAGAVIGGALGVGAACLVFYARRGELELLWTSLVSVPLALDPVPAAPLNLWPPGRFSLALLGSEELYLPRISRLLSAASAPESEGLGVLLSQFLYLLPLLVLAASIARRLSAGPLPAALWVQGAALVALLLNLHPRADWAQLVCVLPAAALQAVLVVAAGEVAPSGRKARLATIGLLVPLAVGVAGVSLGLHRAADPMGLGPHVPQRPVGPGHRDAGIVDAIDYIRRHARPGAPLYVARGEPLLYFATDTRNPTPFPSLVPGLRKEQTVAILAGLDEVGLVVMSEGTPRQRDYGDELPALQRHLERHFRLPDAFRGSPFPGVFVLERGPDRGPTQIDLFERRHEARAFVRDERGLERASRREPPWLWTRQNRRPLAFVLGLGGGGLDFELELPEGARFEADVGMEELHGDRIHQHPEGARLSLSVGHRGGFAEVASWRVLDAGDRANGWRAIEADLSPWAGQYVTLRLALTPEPGKPPRPLAWWGSPRIVAAP